MTGTTLLHYRIIGKLGKGGMGEVYAAEDTKLQRHVALKLLPPEVATDPDRLQRFQREARAIAALNHPNVVTIYSVEETNGTQFLTMELVEGQTLGELIPPEGLPLERLLELALPLVDAVSAAHEHGIIHRDLKPANVMLARDGRLKVLDFGLAKLKPGAAGASGESATTTRLATESLTAAHAIVGTAAYMSPEQAEGRAVDHRTDIFSLGVVLYEMACGRRPFAGDTAFSLISSILKDTPQPLSEVRRDVPVLLDRIVTKALAKNPADRYQSAAELREALRELQQQTAAGRIIRGVVWSVGRSRPIRWAALAVGAILLAAGTTWYMLARGGVAGSRAQTAALKIQRTKLTGGIGVAQFPSLSPDGQWLVYSGEDSGNRDIYLLLTSGQTPRNLTADSPADDDEPTVSRDQKQIAFRSGRDGGGIFVMGFTGENPRRVTPAGVTAAYNPTWSPDGTEIAYTTDNVQLTPLNWEFDSELWVVNVNTGVQRHIAVPNAVHAAWSPNGYRIAFTARRNSSSTASKGPAPTSGTTLDIYTVPAVGGAPVAVTNDSFADWSAAWAPDGKHLYFVSDRAGGMNLWRVAIDERSGKPLGEPEAITNTSPFLAHPTVSGDGRRIAYTEITKTMNIQQLPLDPATGEPKGEPTALTTGSRLWANPDTTPDGEWVTFYSQDQPEGDVYIERRDGTGRRQLTRAASAVVIDRVPRWSPDKAWIAFFSNRSGPSAVWKIRAADGSGLEQVTLNGGVPVWSPDSKRIVTTASIGTRGAFVFDANRRADEQKPEPLAAPDEATKSFIPNDWSPDGSRLVGMTRFSDREGYGIVVYSFATHSYQRLTDIGEWPAWFAGNDRILFVDKGKAFYLYDLRTKQAPRKVYSTLWDVLGPPRVTRDGRAVVFSRRVTQGDIYLLTLE